MSIKVSIVEDSRGTRESLTELLGRAPGMSGIECVARLKQRLPKLQVLMLTTYEESDLIFDSLRSGASGYLLKNMPPAELINAVVQSRTGGSPLSMRIARKIVGHFQQVKAPS